MAETKKYVRILKAPCRSIWYADKIGSIFPSLGTWENAYKVDSPDRALYIRKEDVELIVTEKRPAKVDERVLLTAPTNTKGKHRVGDVFTVREFGETGVHVTEDEFMTLWHKEYEVIVNSEVKNEEADGMKIDLNAMGYDELIAHGEDVIRAIRLHAYGEGYRQGKFDAEMDSTHGQAPAHKSAQARRDEIVEQAKADVERLKENNIRLRTFNISLEVNRKDRSVEAIAKRPKSNRAFYGIAKAAPSDCFNVHIGKAIALRRALGLTVPDEYLNAPQPTEVRVGDVVVTPYGRGPYKLKKRHFSEIDLTCLNRCKIIDDSREEVGE
ncbi:hypothetical protein [Bacillus velezensis]|uniref:hypothetical protein n=1 Tax=Bacillus velezensis TaxID=492670 RepID=UPI00196340E8|nr:hypothetical protein [Bacillus velezensis]